MPMDLFGSPRAIEATQDSMLSVEVDEGTGLVVEDLQPVPDGLLLVVVTRHEGRSVLVAEGRVLRRVELHVVDLPVFLADPGHGEPADQILVWILDRQRR